MQLQGLKIISIDGTEKVIPPSRICNACHDLQEKTRRLALEQERIGRAFRLTPRLKSRTFNNFQVNGLNHFDYDAAMEFNPESGDSILLYGSCGIGKTHLAEAIAHKFLGKIAMLYISCPDLLLEIRESMYSSGKTKRLSVARQAPLLILDDLGAENPSSWVREILFVLINHRYEFKLPAFITTNCSLEELEHRLGSRIVSRLAGMCTCIKFGGEDFRIAKLSHES